MICGGGAREMRRLLIVRHAIAHERDRFRWPDDDDRPLTGAGKRRFRNAARGLSRWCNPPDELLTSTLTRARQTARILEREAGFPRPIQLAELRPDGPAEALMATLRKRRAKSITVVGHEPQLSELMRKLLGDHGGRLVAPLKKGGMAMIGFKRRVEAGGGALLVFALPRALRSALRK